MLDFLPKSLDEFTVPEKMDQAFCVLFAESTYVCERNAYFIKVIIRCNFPVKKLKLESLKFSFFRAVETQDIYDLSQFIKFS